MAYDIKKLNEDLKRDLANMQIKHRVTFHRGNQVHDEVNKKRRNRKDRRSCKKNLHRGDWD